MVAVCVCLHGLLTRYITTRATSPGREIGEQVALRLWVGRIADAKVELTTCIIMLAHRGLWQWFCLDYQS